mgnify:CR=1 FL=1
MPTKVDGVLEQLGPFGPYQFWQQIYTGVPSFVAALHFLIIVFHFVDVRHRSVVYYATSTCTCFHNTGSM